MSTTATLSTATPVPAGLRGHCQQAPGLALCQRADPVYWLKFKNPAAPAVKREPRPSLDALKTGP